jgi:membrane associated rhomboid family serine protease
MPDMEPGHEVEAPATAGPTPRPTPAGAGEAPRAAEPAPPHSPSPPAASLPTAESLLRALAAAEGPWFPSRFAADSRIPRDSLDEPLAELRLAGLVRVAEWVKGAGQVYVLTSEGQAAARNPGQLEQWRQARRSAPAGGSAAEEKAEGPPLIGAGEREAEAESPAGADLALRPPLVVPALLMANVLWFFICAVVGIKWGLAPSRSILEGHADALHRFGAVTGADLLKGEWWRLLTSCFVHIGALHLIGNMFALAMMGPLAELLWGRLRLLLIYLISGLAGSALAMALRPDAMLAGASGAIWGVQMSLFAWLFAFRRHLPPDLASDWFRRLAVVFVLNAGVSFLPGVSWEGHLGGGVAGFLAAGLLNAARFGDRHRRAAAWLLLALLPALFVGGLAAAMDAKGVRGWQQLRQRLAARRQVQEDRERAQRLTEALGEFGERVEPRLRELAPDAVQPAERNALLLLARKKRPAELLNPARARLGELKAAADEVVRLAAAGPTGSERFDRTRERARAFAAARSRALGLLLAMLDSPELPKAEAWKEWQSARRDADRLWGELTAR